MRKPVVAAVLLALCTMAGCSGSDDPPPPPNDPRVIDFDDLDARGVDANGQPDPNSDKSLNAQQGAANAPPTN